MTDGFPAVPLRQVPYFMRRAYAGTRVTVEHMAKVMWTASHSRRLMQFAREIITKARVREYDQTGELKALFGWVKAHVRYTKDPHQHELLQTPAVTLITGHGDCDCKAMLLGSMLMSIGYPVRIVIVGKAPGKYHHVFIAARYRQDGRERWIDLDPTLSAGFGLPLRFPVRREFEIGENGALKEPDAPASYTLSDFLGGLLSGPPLIVTIRPDGGRAIRVPWSLQDLPYVSDAEWLGWRADLMRELTPDEAGTLAGLADSLGELAGLEGFFDKFKKGLKKVAAPLAVVAAPITGGASLAAYGAYKGAKMAKGAKPDAAPKASSRQPRKEKTPRKKPVEVEVTPGTPQLVPEIKAEGSRNYLLMGGGLAAAGGAAYLATRD